MCHIVSKNQAQPPAQCRGKPMGCQRTFACQALDWRLLGACALAKRLVGACFGHKRRFRAHTALGMRPTSATAQQAPTARQAVAWDALGVRSIFATLGKRFTHRLRKRQACAQCARIVRETFSIRLFSPNVRRMCAELALVKREFFP